MMLAGQLCSFIFFEPPRAALKCKAKLFELKRTTVGGKEGLTSSALKVCVQPYCISPSFAFQIAEAHWQPQSLNTIRSIKWYYRPLKSRAKQGAVFCKYTYLIPWQLMRLRVSIAFSQKNITTRWSSRPGVKTANFPAAVKE